MIRTAVIGLFMTQSLVAQQNLNDLPTDLTVPVVQSGSPAPGKRLQAEKGTHLIYLPTDWSKEKTWPVIVEYPGNGGFSNKLGDVSDGTAAGCVMGYGLSAGKDYIWVSMPFVNADGTEATKWWGDVETTKRYCIDTVRAICKDYHGDPKRVVLMGFSRGAIACNYIGLHDDKIAALWCGMLCHSHYDGVREGWGYAGADRQSALIRLKRLNGRPQWISHEQTTAPTQAWLKSTGISGTWEFHPLPFSNHSARWTLCDLPIRTQARAWLHAVCASKPE